MTIKDLLNKLHGEGSLTGKAVLENTTETWQRIGNRDSFSELGFSTESEKEAFLAEWIENNPYSNI